MGASYCGFAEVGGEVLGVGQYQIGFVQECFFGVGLVNNGLPFLFNFVPLVLNDGHPFLDLCEAERLHFQGDE